MDNPKIDAGGTKRWYDLNGKHHRTDGPAVEYAHGTKFWYLYGKQHRADGPAAEWADGDKWWYLNDKLLSFDRWLDEVDISAEVKVMLKLKYG
tara:strand:- start:16 stop:294 length:279 start_codon:yes stop_codon:yes gene_type:complete